MPKKEPEVEEPQTVPFLVYLKGFLLVIAVLFGMFFLSQASKQQSNSDKKVESVTLSSIYNLKDSITKEKIQNQIEHEMRTNDRYKDTVSLIEDKTDEVLGEATKAAEQAKNQAKKTFFDYMYERTVGAVIKRVVEQMPEEQKEKLIEEVQ